MLCPKVTFSLTGSYSTPSRFHCKYSTGCLLIHVPFFYDVVLRNSQETWLVLGVHSNSDFIRLTGELVVKVAIRREIGCARQDIKIRVFSWRIDSQLPKLIVTINGQCIESRGRERWNWAPIPIRSILQSANIHINIAYKEPITVILSWLDPGHAVVWSARVTFDNVGVANLGALLSADLNK